jgi:hypothetical protein
MARARRRLRRRLRPRLLSARGSVDWFTACAIDDALRELEDESLGGGSRTSRWGESLGRVAGGRLGGRWACVTACAAFLGDLELVRLARDCGHEWDAYTCAFAAYSGNLECLKYAHEHGCPWNKSTCRYAAWNGDLESLKYAHEHGCPWDEETCACAAYSGHLECLKYAHERGCPWDEETCKIAAENGHLECLKYAHEHGCPWNEETCACAAYTGHLGCLKYGRMVHGVDVESHASTSGPTRSASARTHALRSRTGLPFSQCSATHAHPLSSTYASRCTPSIDSSPHAGLLTWIYAPGGVKKRVSHPRARSANASPRR